MSKRAESATVNYSSVEYILDAGHNRIEPIREFRLRFVKEKPECPRIQLQGFCGSA
jgi:hypothetical protein